MSLYTVFLKYYQIKQYIMEHKSTDAFLVNGQTQRLYQVLQGTIQCIK